MQATTGGEPGGGTPGVVFSEVLCFLEPLECSPIIDCEDVLKTRLQFDIGGGWRSG